MKKILFLVLIVLSVVVANVMAGDGENQPPTIDSVEITPDCPITHDNLTAHVSGLNDPNGDDVSVVYNWFVNDNPIAVLNMPMTPPVDGIVYDFSTKGNDGVLYGNPEFNSSGGYNGLACYDFDGVGDYINFGTEFDVPTWNSYTISVWFLNDGGGDLSNGYGQKIIDKTIYWHDFYLSVLSHYDGQLRFRLYENGGVALIDNSHDYRDNQWHHAVIVKDGTYGEMWVDGELKDTSNNLKAVYSSGKFLIGYSLSIDGYQRKYWSGKIDDLIIFDRSLSEEQIQLMYNSGLGRYDTIVSQETKVSEEWEVGAAPVDEHGLNGSTVYSDAVTIENDIDGDGVCDSLDNCPLDYNPEQEDFDEDNIGDACDSDDDNDGVLDGEDNCPFEDATGFDADIDGCIDTLDDLPQVIGILPDEVLSDEIKNSVVSKVDNAMKSVDKEKDEAAINMLQAFINQVEAQRGKKISEEAADMLIAYANNVIGQI